MKEVTNKKLLAVGFQGEHGEHILSKMEGTVKKIIRINNYNELNLGYIDDQDFTLELPFSVENYLLETSFQNYQRLISRRGLYFNNFPDSRDEFILLLKYTHSLLLKEKVDAVIFSNIPHEGVDYVVYIMAQKLGLRTVIAYQSIFINRFFLIQKIEDFGEFNTTAFNSGKPIKVSEYKSQGLTYMSGSVGFSPKTTVYINKVQQYFSRISKFKGLFSKYLLKHRLLKSLEFIDTIRYGKAEKKYFCNDLLNINNNDKFIYFPLHLQPELTTAAIGAEYDDQLLALEHLSSIIPEGVKIIVKENPKQNNRYRSLNFFKRLETINNTILVSRSVLSTDILDASFAVATITGTAGWEAIMEGKLCIYFGLPWFKSFNNAFHIKDVNRDVLSNFINVDNNVDVNTQLASLSKKMPLGVIDPYYLKFSKNISPSENSINVAEAILSEIE